MPQPFNSKQGPDVLNGVIVKIERSQISAAMAKFIWQRLQACRSQLQGIEVQVGCLRTEGAKSSTGKIYFS